MKIEVSQEAQKITNGIATFKIRTGICEHLYTVNQIGLCQFQVARNAMIVFDTYFDSSYIAFQSLVSRGIEEGEASIAFNEFIRATALIYFGH